MKAAKSRKSTAPVDATRRRLVLALPAASAALIVKPHRADAEMPSAAPSDPTAESAHVKKFYELARF